MKSMPQGISLMMSFCALNLPIVSVGYEYGFAFRTICFVRKSELGTVSSLKTPNREYCRQFSIFKCI